MNKSILTLVLLVSMSSAFAQIQVKGLVLDQETKKPIPFVNIGFKAIQKGTVSTMDGVYQLEASDSALMVTFSAIGYQDQEVSLQALSTDATIHLNPKDYALGIIEVVAKKWEEGTVMLGSAHKKKENSINFGSSQLGTQVGALIEVEQETFLQSANFVLNHAKGDSMHFRLNIYKVNNDVIDENILTENILIQTEQKKGLLTIDLTPYDIVVDQDVLLALQWIKDDGEYGNQGVSFRAKRSKRGDNFFLTTSSVGQLKRASSIAKRMPKFQLSFYFIGKQAK